MINESRQALESAKPEMLTEHREDEESGVRSRESTSIVRNKIKKDGGAQTAEQISKIREQIRNTQTIPESKTEPVSSIGPVSFMEKLRKKVKRNKFAIALFAAMGLHYPVTPQGQAMVEDVVDAARGARSEWEKQGMVISPQSRQERDEVVALMYERGARSDVNANARAKDKFGSRLDQGEDVPLDEIYFELAKTGGEDPERIKEAKKRKDEMVEKLAKRMGSHMTDSFIRSVVEEMYGSDANYIWGQASVTEYFLTGKRSCVAIARAEQMVFEALVAHLPIEERGKYQIGLAFEKQHEIATISIMNPDGSVDRTLYLQPPIRTLESANQELGAPTIPLATVKNGLVSPKPITVVSPENAGEKVADSPDIDAISNDPVGLNIKVQGPLRGSDYVRSVAKERNIVPVLAAPEKLVDVQDLELRVGDEEVVRRYNDETRKSLVELQKLRSKMPNLQGRLTYNRLFDVSQLEFLQTVERGQRPLDKLVFNQVEIPIGFEMAGSILEHIPAREIWFTGCESNLQVCQDFMNYLSVSYEDSQKSLPLLGLSADSITKLWPRDFKNSPAHYLARIALDIDRNPMQAVHPSEFVALLSFPANEIYIKGTFLIEIDGDWLRKMGESSKRFHLESRGYLHLLLEHPELAEYDNINPWLTHPLDVDLWEEVYKRHSGKVGPRFKKMMHVIRDESEEKFSNGGYDKRID